MSISVVLPTVVKIKRSKGVIVQDCDVYIGRQMNMGGWRLPKSYWYNPYPLKSCKDIDDCLQKYRIYLIDLFYEDKEIFIERLRALSGKRLGCWCKIKASDKCHGDIIVEFFQKLIIDGRKDIE